MTHDHGDHADQHGHGHRHRHGHGDGDGDYGRAFTIGIALNLAYVAGEAGFGVYAGSLALLADAGHNLADALGLGLAWGAAWLAQRRPNQRFTYGFRSSTILAALANAIILLVVTGGIAREAWLRFGAPVPVASGIVIWVAAVGIAVNGGTALLFAGGRRGDLNLAGAFAHMAADALVTAAVVVTGVVIGLTGWQWLDPAVGLAVSAVVVIGTWRLLRSAVGLALDAVPETVDGAAVRTHLMALPGVAALHDLHIWGMSTTETALTCHLVMPTGHPGDAALCEIARDLHERFGIDHTTIQIELADSEEDCVLTPESVV